MPLRQPPLLSKSVLFAAVETFVISVTKQNTPPWDVSNTRAGDAVPGEQMVPENNSSNEPQARSESCRKPEDPLKKF